jgi:hypothetical protein
MADNQAQTKVVVHIDPSGSADPIPFGVGAPPFVVIRVQLLAGELSRYSVTSSDPTDEGEEDIVQTARVPSRIVQTSMFIFSWPDFDSHFQFQSISLVCLSSGRAKTHRHPPQLPVLVPEPPSLVWMPSPVISSTLVQVPLWVTFSVGLSASTSGRNLPPVDHQHTPRRLRLEMAASRNSRIGQIRQLLLPQQSRQWMIIRFVPADLPRDPGS